MLIIAERLIYSPLCSLYTLYHSRWTHVPPLDCPPIECTKSTLSHSNRCFHKVRRSNRPIKCEILYLIEEDICIVVIGVDDVLYGGQFLDQGKGGIQIVACQLHLVIDVY